MGKIGWSALYAAGAVVAAPAVAGAAVLTVGYWLDETIRRAAGQPLRWEIDNGDDVRLDRQLADLSAELGRQRA